MTNAEDPGTPTQARNAFAAALATEMRTPLARVELAASQLMRESVTPAARHLVDRVSQAVGDLDELIGKLLALLMPSSSDHRRPIEMAPMLGSLHSRLAPVLAARGVEWPAPVAPTQDVFGDARRCPRAVLALLRVAGELAGEGGWLNLALLSDNQRVGFVVIIHSAKARAAKQDVVRATLELRRFALSEGAELILQEHQEGIEITIWLDPLPTSVEQSPSDSEVTALPRSTAGGAM